MKGRLAVGLIGAGRLGRVYARDLALELGYPASAASVVQLAALLHDVGKIGVSGEILRKPSKLSDEEWALVSPKDGAVQRKLVQFVQRHVHDPGEVALDHQTAADQRAHHVADRAVFAQRYQRADEWCKVGNQ